MTLCKNGLHELDPTDDWRASNGARCRECYLTVQSSYNASGKGRGRNRRYDQSAAGIQRKIQYDIEVRGRDEEWILYGPRGDALREREEYETSGSSLSFLDWLNETYPLPKLIGRG